jgi:hypothetical protein
MDKEAILKIQNNILVDFYQEISQEVYGDVYNAFKDDHYNFSFINFNYTSTLAEYIKCFDVQRIIDQNITVNIENPIYIHKTHTT